MWHTLTTNADVTRGVESRGFSVGLGLSGHRYAAGMHALTVVMGLTLWCLASWSVLRTLVVPRGASQLISLKNGLLRVTFRLVPAVDRATSAATRC